LFGVPDVNGHRETAVAELGSDRLRPIDFNVCDDHASAGAMKCLCGCAAQTGGSAGHKSASTL
jgi:hypothetical protein